MSPIVSIDSTSFPKNSRSYSPPAASLMFLCMIRCLLIATNAQTLEGLGWTRRWAICTATRLDGPSRFDVVVVSDKCIHWREVGRNCVVESVSLGLINCGAVAVRGCALLSW